MIEKVHQLINGQLWGVTSIGQSSSNPNNSAKARKKFKGPPLDISNGTRRSYLGKKLEAKILLRLSLSWRGKLYVLCLRILHVCVLMIKNLNHFPEPSQPVLCLNPPLWELLSHKMEFPRIVSPAGGDLFTLYLSSTGGGKALWKMGRLRMRPSNSLVVRTIE